MTADDGEVGELDSGGAASVGTAVVGELAAAAPTAAAAAAAATEITELE